MKPTRRSYYLIFAAIAAAATSSRVSAQSLDRDRHNFETRADLEAQARDADAKGLKGQAYLIHYRLDHGDFHEGDRVAVKVEGTAGFTDTLVVRAGKTLQLPQMGEVPLEGVLRSELTSRLVAYIGKYLKEPSVVANPLVRVGVLGSVGHPGYYYTSADLPLSDVLMTAGGPTAEADVTKVSIKREGEEILDRKNTSTALAEGMSLDMLHLQAGDEILVGEKNRLNWQVIVPTVTGILTLVIAFTQLRH